ncbi:SRPBCC domain-containing protein [Christiangramia echinicola]|uniref:SRPBCC domain-containing protein n=1 Tax=Christiangramia echinicola TaxID=279359 RepID=UPI0003F84811|nr:SRPBCC domain-containing protein [Christiangramia echinicola]
MKRLHYQIEIKCPQENVFSTMLNEKHYREWTAIFSPGSHYEGNWEEGSEIKFLTITDSGEKEGMLSKIKKVEANKYISIQHLAMLQKGKEIPFKGGSFYENYYFVAKGNSTVLKVEMDTEDDWFDYFDKTWPKALQKLKEVCEENC